VKWHLKCIEVNVRYTL